MKKKTSIMLMAIFSLILFNQNLNGQDCINSNSNTVSDSSSAIGTENISTGKYSLASGYQNISSGLYSHAFGSLNEANGDYSIAMVKKSIANGNHSIAIGFAAIAAGDASVAIGAYTNTLSEGTLSVAIGSRVTTSHSRTMILGYGLPDNPIINNIENSLMIGLNSDIPTLYISPSNGVGTIGKIGIGTTDPQELLEVNGTFKVNDWSYMNNVDLGGAYIKNVDALIGKNSLKFKGQDSAYIHMILTEEGKLGIGSLEPDAKLQVNGNIFIDDPFSGLILKSPDGQCWKGTANNCGNFVLERIDCNLITGNVTTSINKLHSIRIFPNPGAKILNIEIPLDMQQAYVLFFSDQGVLLQQNKIQAGNNIISLIKLANGILIVKVLNAQGEFLLSEKILNQ
ncbi:MAG: hypothetical protein DRJ05_02880 [Bacteroidetes bacterium]|nr:MAG: hypothetical protein DRJ05_02880 [Bacteroidota bacterium]